MAGAVKQKRLDVGVAERLPAGSLDSLIRSSFWSRGRRNVVSLHGSRAPRRGSHARRPYPTERELIYWALTRAVLPARPGGVARGLKAWAGAYRLTDNEGRRGGVISLAIKAQLA